MILVLNILLLLLIGVLVTFVVQKYVPLDEQIKMVLIAIVWIVVLIAFVRQMGIL